MAAKTVYFAILIPFLAPDCTIQGFLPSQQNLHTKTNGKSAKIIDFGLPNPPQNPSKRVPEMKSTKSDNFLDIFNCSEKFQKGRPLILSPWPVFCKLFCLITLQASANLPRQKKQKNSSKPCLIHEKNDAKVMLFFHVAFFAF